MANENRMKKIKITKERKIHIVFEKWVKDTWDEYSITCCERAKPSFYTTMAKLIVQMRDLCELPDGYETKLQVKSVSFSYAGDDEVMGAVLTGTMELTKSNCPLNLNTPYKPSMPYSEGMDEDTCLPDECVEILWKLCAEAQDYIDGEREQLKLFKENEEKGEISDEDNSSIESKGRSREDNDSDQYSIPPVNEEPCAYH
jgi:hypothetical protein